MWRLEGMASMSPESRTALEEYQSATGRDGDDADLEVSNRYQALTNSFTATCLLFLCQATLGFYYIYELNHRSSEERFEGASPWRWFIGLSLCTIAGETELGGDFEVGYWVFLSKQEDLMKKRTRIFYCIPTTYSVELRIRGIMSLIVNLFLRRIILGTAPILLGVESPLDFIKDCLAVFFITKLDDLEKPLNLKSMRARLLHQEKSTSLLDGEDDDARPRVSIRDIDREIHDLRAEVDALRQRVDQKC
eukprot:CAMPEP_0179186594 /NCGR_PEP_ID=MMETSP0796-20121207/92555_1 /TAXON_ID=73915 /ORGANISM="Pyrodinium bahamense, Strain pbaha01" /LENGTH=248 /DNA_ID=CAMNT_0020890599 /DNA_START=251 /DNA_END=997 /DNA_ORIENTATION=+